MKTAIYIATLMMMSLISLSLHAQQDDLPVACGDQISRYGVHGTTGSDFVWEVDGGEIVNFFNDSVDIRWDANADKYIITVTETNIYGCTGEPYYAVLMVSSPFLDLGLDQDICSGEVYEIAPSMSKDLQLTWQDGTSGDTYQASATGSYWALGTDPYGCPISDTVDITVHALPVVDLGPDTMLCGDLQTLELDAQNEGAFYTWSTGDISQQIIVYNRDERQEISVEVEDVYGCIGTDTVVVEICNDPDFLIIPTAITPNGDGSNDTWQIDNLWVIENVKVDIYDRWGRRVFHSNGYSADQYWDGTDERGKELPMDSYYYVIEVGTGEKPKMGTVTIIR